MLCNSWIVTRKDTGEAILETYNPEIAARINLQKYNVQTALKYLQEFNLKVKQGNSK